MVKWCLPLHTNRGRSSLCLFVTNLSWIIGVVATISVLVDFIASAVYIATYVRTSKPAALKQKTWWGSVQVLKTCQRTCLQCT